MSDRRDKDRHRSRRYSKSRSRSRSHSSGHKRRHHSRERRERHDRDRSDHRDRERDRSDDRHHHHRKSSSHHDRENKQHSKSRRRSRSRSKSSNRRSKSYSRSSSRERERHHRKQHHHGFKTDQEESDCLIVTGLNDEITQEKLNNMLSDLAIELQTSQPEKIQLVPIFKTAYAVFPSVEAAKKILFSQKGKLNCEGLMLSMDFYPSETAARKQQKQVEMIQDWICDKCDYNNFAKRPKCNKCGNPKNINCKPVFNSPLYAKQPMGQQSYYNSGIGFQQQGPGQSGPGMLNADANTSLMVRGNVLMDIDESVLLDAFSQFAPVKDIRMVKNKQTGGMKDFAFIEFYSIDEAENVLKMTSGSDFKIRGKSVMINFSKNRKGQDDGTKEGEEDTPNTNNTQNNAFSSDQVQYPDYQYFTNQDGTINQAAYAQYMKQYQEYMKSQQQNELMAEYTVPVEAKEEKPQAQTSEKSSGMTDLDKYLAQLQPSLVQQTIHQQHSTQKSTQQAPSAQSNFQFTSAQSYIESRNQQKEGEQNTAANKQEENKIIDEKENKGKDEQKIKEEMRKNEEARKQLLAASKVEAKKDPKLSKLEEDKAKRKQIAMELKRWEREQQLGVTSSGPSIQVGSLQQTDLDKNQKIEEEKIDIKNSFAPTEISKPKTSRFQDSINQKPEVQAVSYKVYLPEAKVQVCRLCMRKFNNEDEIELHEQISRMHKDNLTRVKVKN